MCIQNLQMLYYNLLSYHIILLRIVLFEDKKGGVLLHWLLCLQPIEMPLNLTIIVK